jgi:hypothetical protein
VVDFGVHGENRARLLAALPAGVPTNSVILLQGGKGVTRDDTGVFVVRRRTEDVTVCVESLSVSVAVSACWHADHEPLFRQESWFHWAFGVREPDFFGAIHVGTRRFVRAQLLS